MQRLVAIWTILLFQFAATLSGFASSALQRYEYSRLEMGTLFRVVVYAESSESAESGAQAALDRVQELNGILSDYQEDSELNQVCRTAFENPRVVSPELFFVLQKSLQMSRRTEGAFDITIRPLVKLWRQAGDEKKLPEDQQIQEALSRSGFQKVLLNPLTRSVRLRQQQMELDLGGIAKGYALDEAMRILHQHGITRAMVDGGGDLRIGESPPGKRGWTIELAGDTGQEILPLQNIAVATSGDLYRFFEIDGVRYSHIVDPATGLGLKRSPQVTVIAPYGIEADALATALSVMPPGEGLALIERLAGTEARLSVLNGREKRIISSSGFPP